MTDTLTETPVAPASDPTADLLWAVAEQIEAHPEQHDQKTWVFRPCVWEDIPWDGQRRFRLFEKDLATGFGVDCDTTRCVAGWATALAKADLSGYRSHPEAAMDLLGLPDSGAAVLFGMSTQHITPGLLRHLSDLPPEQRTAETIFSYTGTSPGILPYL